MAPPGGTRGARDAFSPPAQVDEYVLLRQLGRGGMGTVWVARDTLLDRLVAVKFIAAPDPDATARARFANEARALARLAHRNVVTVHRVGEVDGHPYIVCELVEGRSLAQIDLPLPPARVAEIGLSAARGLAAVHRHGLLHRDLKPGNLALMPDGEVKLLDFGLATLADGARAVAPTPELPARDADWTITDHHRAVGTRAYLAPEIFDGVPASRRSDLYALGAVLHELASGAPPALTDLDPDPPSDDAALNAVIARCLADEPELRYASAEQLCDALEQLHPTARDAPVPAGNPYRGLAPFDAEHRSLFFGRAVESRAVLDRLRAEPLVLVAGASGVGKSSLCRAGVLPLVADGQLDPQRGATVVTVVPGRRPVTALAAALARLLSLSEERCADLIRAEPGALGRALRRRLGAHEALVVFVDQAEELCTLSAPLEAAQASEALASFGGGPLRVLMAVRGDLFTRLAALPGLADGLPGSLYLLRSLSKEQLREAIVGPALRAGGRFESEALVATLVDAAAGAPGGLALLSFALAELWELRDAARQVIPAEALARIGGVSGALARHADALLATLPQEQRAAVPRLLTRLVTAHGTRARRTAGELGLGAAAGRPARTLGEAQSGSRGAAQSEPAPPLTLLEALVRGRLLVASELEGETAYELAHEALIEGWDALRGWLDSDAEARATRHRLVATAAEWERLGREPALLWRERQLVETDRLDEHDLGGREREFLAASRRADRRRRATVVGTVVAALLFTGGVYGALRLQASAELAGAIRARREPAVQALADATTEALQAETRRQTAFARFRDPAAGGRAPDVAWQEGLDAYDNALALDGVAESRLLGASRSLEAALLLDPHHEDVRELLGDVTRLRIAIAERTFRHDARDELRARLETYAAGSAASRDLDAPATLTVTTRPAGATVMLERYVDDGGRRALSPPETLGATPLAARALPAGSYRLSFAAPGRAPVRYPVLLARGETLRVDVDLPSAGEVPDGMIYVPPGRFLFGSAEEGLRRFLLAPPQHEVRSRGYLIARTEVTFADWLAFLRDLPPATRARHLPQVVSAIRGSLELRMLADGRFQLALQPASRRYVAVEGEPLRYEGRARRAEGDWRRFPVAAVSWNDVAAYAAWLDRTRRVPGARPCDEHEWERAARGADDRVYPHGDRLLSDDANHDATYGRKPEAFGPDEVASHPASDSPFGVADLVGNVWEWTSSIEKPGSPSVRGGSYYQEQFTNRSTNRDVGEADARDPLVGARICASFAPRVAE